jgi:Lipase (class 3)
MNTNYWARPPQTPALNAQLCSMIDALRTADPVSGIKAVPGPGFTLGDESIDAAPQTSTVPNYATWSYPNGLLVLLGGMQNNGLITPLLNGWYSPPTPASVSGINPAFEVAAAQIVAANAALWAKAVLNYQFVGHSWGGGVACALALQAAANFPTSNITLITYGMPKLGIFSGCRTVGQLGGLHWWTTDDNVPTIPPNWSESASLQAILPRNLRVGVSAQCKPGGGWNLGPLGVITQEDYGSRRWPGTILDLVVAMTSGAGFANAAHAIDAYRIGFVLAANNPTIPLANPRPRETPPNPQPTAREVNAAIRIGEADIFADAISPTGVTRNYVPPVVHDPDAPRYRAARDGKVWVVMIGGNIVAAASGKRHAKHLARAWNRSARAALDLGV